MLGGLMGGMPTEDSQPADLETKWLAKFQDPSVMAGLLSFGANLMKPTWSPGAAMADAISGGAQAYAGVEAEKYRRAKEEEKTIQGLEEKEADRANRVKVAEIGADSRAEVANIRAAAAINSMQERDRLKREMAGPFTPQENARYNTLVRTYSKQIENDITRLGKPIDPAEVAQKAAETARNIILGERVGAGGQAPGAANAGGNSSTNSASGGGPVGQGGVGKPSENSSKNKENEAPKRSFNELRDLMKSAGTWHPQFDEDPRRLKPYVSDPDYIDNYFMSKNQRKGK